MGWLFFLLLSSASDWKLVPQGLTTKTESWGQSLTSSPQRSTWTRVWCLQLDDLQVPSDCPLFQNGQLLMHAQRWSPIQESTLLCCRSSPKSLISNKVCQRSIYGQLVSVVFWLVLTKSNSSVQINVLKLLRWETCWWSTKTSIHIVKQAQNLAGNLVLQDKEGNWGAQTRPGWPWQIYDICTKLAKAQSQFCLPSVIQKCLWDPKIGGQVWLDYKITTLLVAKLIHFTIFHKTRSGISYCACLLCMIQGSQASTLML